MKKKYTVHGVNGILRDLNVDLQMKSDDVEGIVFDDKNEQYCIIKKTDDNMYEFFDWRSYPSSKFNRGRN